jgi:hydrogenase-4 component B
VSEFFLYLGFFGEARAAQPYVALGAPVLALVGGVAVVSFVKLIGITFLGEPRSAEAAHCHEAGSSMLFPMALLAGLCLLGGIFPQLFLGLIKPVVSAFTPAGAALPQLPIQPLWFTVSALSLLLLAALIFAFLRRRESLLPAGSGPTWGCGYLQPSGRIQYTASSFGAMFGSVAAPLIRSRIRRSAIAGVAPAAATLSYLPEETVLYRVILPVLSLVGKGFAFLRRLQHGEVQVYILYVFVTLVLLMVL